MSGDKPKRPGRPDLRAGLDFGRPWAPAEPDPEPETPTRPAPRRGPGLRLGLSQAMHQVADMVPSRKTLEETAGELAEAGREIADKVTGALELGDLLAGALGSDNDDNDDNNGPEGNHGT